MPQAAPCDVRDMRAAPASLPLSDLDRLLATEQRLGERLATARAEGEAVIAAARAAAECRERTEAEEASC